MATTTVLVADSQVLFADALATSLRQHDQLTILDDLPCTGTDVLQAVTEHRPDVVLLDYWLAELSGPDGPAWILTRAPDTKVLHLSWFHGPREVRASLDAGAVGFLPKSLRVAKVTEAIQRAVAGEDPVFEQELSRLVGTILTRDQHIQNTASRFAMLTSRELAVLRYLAAGLTLNEIAKRLGIKEATARTHVHRILTKIQAHSQLEAVALARDQGLVP